MLNENSATVSKYIATSEAGAPQEYHITNDGISVIPHGLLVLNQDVCWMWDESGQLYFTNDGFQNIYAEDVKSGDATVPVHGMFLAEDGTTVFAYHKGRDDTVILFRY